MIHLPFAINTRGVGRFLIVVILTALFAAKAIGDATRRRRGL